MVIRSGTIDIWRHFDRIYRTPASAVRRLQSHAGLGGIERTTRRSFAGRYIAFFNYNRWLKVGYISPAGQFVQTDLKQVGTELHATPYYAAAAMPING